MKIWRLAGIAVAMIAISVAVLSVVVVNNTPDRALTDAAAQPEVVAALPASSEVAAASEGTSPIDDSLASAWYRREVVGVHLRRLLTGHE